MTTLYRVDLRAFAPALLVSGHTLRSEGAPFDENGNHIYPNGPRGGVSGTGRAKCSCGEVSEPLPSAYKRKAWHRGHKVEIRAGAS